MELNSGVEGFLRAKVDKLRRHVSEREKLPPIVDPKAFIAEERSRSSPDNLLTIEASVSPSEELLSSIQFDLKNWQEKNITSESLKYNWEEFISSRKLRINNSSWPEALDGLRDDRSGLEDVDLYLNSYKHPVGIYIYISAIIYLFLVFFFKK